MPTTIGGVTLPDDLEWVDEFGWNPVVSAREYTIAGSMDIQQSKRYAGRPITLSSPDESRGWVTKTIMKAIIALAEVEDQEYTLEINDGRTFNVMFDHSVNPVEGVPLYFINEDEGSHPYLVTIKMFEV